MRYVLMYSLGTNYDFTITEARFYMKKILIGLLVLGSFSSFACDYCVGAKVITDLGKVGIISGKIQDDKVAIAYGSNSVDYSYEISKVALTTGCTSDGFCVGDKVITDYQMVGIVRGVFQSGKVAIEFFEEWDKERYFIWKTFRIGLISRR